MQKKFSAYLSIYNDWNILPIALRSIADRIDELVVVDGGYEWMLPFLQATGRNPEKSDRRVYDAIASCGVRTRFISRIWKNELEKRMAGYAACQNRYVYRVDADEIMFFDDIALERFLSAGGAVAEMDMPMMIAPGWMASTKPIARQGLLFDRQRIETDIHLNYLWLDLRADTLPRAAERPSEVFSEPIAFNAHLSEWRHWETAINRAAFYALNNMRGRGVPWLTEFRNKPLSSVRWERTLALAPPRQNITVSPSDCVKALRSIEYENRATDAKVQTRKSVWTETAGTVRRSLPSAKGIKKAGAARTPNHATRRAIRTPNAQISSSALIR